MKNRQIRIIAVLLATVLAYAGLIGAAAVTAQAADNAPVVQPVTAQTCVDIAVEAELSATDADNDVVLYQLTEKPRLGTAKIEGSTLYYTPGRKAGRDSFHYTAVDERETQRSLPLSRLRLKRIRPDSPIRTWTVIRRITRRSIYRKRV